MQTYQEESGPHLLVPSVRKGHDAVVLSHPKSKESMKKRSGDYSGSEKNSKASGNHLWQVAYREAQTIYGRVVRVNTMEDQSPKYPE